MAPTEHTKVQEPKEGPPQLSDVADILDEGTFEQILEMDDDDERDFSKGIVYGFFDQAKTTFEKMEKAVKDEDLDELSSLGHFLKGSSATLGMTHVKDGCEKIQHYGARKDETGSTSEPDDKVSLKKIDTTVKDVKIAYAKVERFLRRYYGEELKPEEEKKEEKEEKEEKKEEEKVEQKEDVKKDEKKEDPKDKEPKKA
ncbi:hypothetical protein N7466_007630 [Penicillium verhagenii]|uniref:uncharacterized protein n=1 Tax=Penicillium verhagenii TaxID=1562060 RepID=UPI002545AEF4|nr:uncharacterized protein N7466_007630 [Penicillium verhagenii]KAJ5928674.1 hypothetical protein N7466_007630 [Penicillium verhagenii]